MDYREDQWGERVRDMLDKHEPPEPDTPSFMVFAWWIWAITIGLVIAGVMYAAKVQAADWVVVSIGSYHFERDKGYQEVNPGLGFELGRGERWSLIGGAYNNSHGRLSVYAGATYLPWRWHGARLGSFVGVVTGYEAKPLPVVLPTVAIERDGFGVNLVAAPKRGDSPGMVGFQLKWQF